MKTTTHTSLIIALLSALNIKHLLLPAFLFVFAACPLNADVARVLLLGDSVALGYERELGRQLKGKAQLRLFEGNAGNSSQTLKILQAAREKGKVKGDWLLLNCGLNDIKTIPSTGARQVPLAQYEKNLNNCVAEAKRMNLRVVWISTTPIVDEIHNKLITRFHRYAADVEAYNAAAKRVMDAEGVPIIDLYEFSKALIPGGYKDHANFNSKAAAKQAEFLSRELIPLLQQGLPSK